MPFNYLSLNDNISKRELLDNFDQLVNHCNTLEARLNQVTSTPTSSSASNTEVVNARHPFATLSERLGASVFKPKYFKFASYQIEENDDGEEVFSYEGLTFFNQEEIKVIGDGEVVLNHNKVPMEAITPLAESILDRSYYAPNTFVTFRVFAIVLVIPQAMIEANEQRTLIERFNSVRQGSHHRSMLDTIGMLLKPTLIKYVSGLIAYLLKKQFVSKLP